MRFPLFSRKDAALDRQQDQTERFIAESFRALAQLCGKVADFVDSQRLTRQGYAPPGSFLERSEPSKDKGPKAKTGG